MEKQEFQEKAKQSIDDIFAKIDELKLKKETVEADLKITIDEQIKKLEAKKDELELKYKDLIDAAEDKWDDVKDAFSQSADSIKDAFSKVFSPFKKSDEKEEK
jgi:hypothetical protein